MYSRHLKWIGAAAFCVAGLGTVHAALPGGNPLASVERIYLDTNGCTPQFQEELSDAEYRLEDSPITADAVMKVDVHQLDASMGASARYTANLIDPDGSPLFAFSGREDSISQEELCEDISEDVVEELEDQVEDVS